MKYHYTSRHVSFCAREKQTLNQEQTLNQAKKFYLKPLDIMCVVHIADVSLLSASLNFFIKANEKLSFVIKFGIYTPFQLK